jgi:hypothetical protein
MASAYGRGGVQTGGTGGTTLHEAYGFKAKDASSYLTGGLANEYSAQKGVLEKDLYSGSIRSKKGQKKVSKQLSAKQAAKGKIGTLRDIASANAVGSFLDFADTKGRGSMATAGKGLITGETYGFGSEGSASQIDYIAGKKGKYKGRIKKALGLGRGSSKESQREAMRGATAAESFNPGGALSYAGAMGGDPRGQLHSSFKSLQAGDTSVEAAFGFDQPGVQKHRGGTHGRMAMKAMMDRKYGKTRYLGESQGKIADPASVLYGGQGAYQQGRIRAEDEENNRSRFGRY